ncbi:MAG TPA: GNAT family N-acetyltransferase [Acidimicrobiales bacterium]|nr:GNAT family N-acetyltransferase [Acidimicrobiales bacterium]
MSEPQVRPITAEETRPLRHAVLRPGQSFEQTVYSRDDHPETVHLGAFDGDRLVAIASLYREARPNRPRRAAWRLRGMATDAEHQGRGLATVVLEVSVAHVAAEGGGELWCNARLPALGFYQRGGFEIEGDEFEIDGIGPHVVVTRTVDPADTRG